MEPEPINLDEVYINEDLWGPDSTDTVKEWLAEHYKPESMPALELGRTEDGKLSLLGWDAGEWPPLMTMIFGEGYTAARIEQVKSALRDGAFDA